MKKLRGILTIEADRKIFSLRLIALSAIYVRNLWTGDGFGISAWWYPVGAAVHVRFGPYKNSHTITVAFGPDIKALKSAIFLRKLRSMDEAQREMTLPEWCAKLPKNHKVNVEFRELLNNQIDSSKMTTLHEERGCKGPCPVDGRACPKTMDD